MKNKFVARFVFPFAVLISVLPSLAVQFPDTTELKHSYVVGTRENGLPTALFRKARGDSGSLTLEWSKKVVVVVRIEQSREFDPDSFAVLNAEYGNGAAWHESHRAKDPIALKLYPGLQQEWHLQGYGGGKGWLGSGVNKGRYFLVFRASPPTAVIAVTSPLRLQGNLWAFLDTSSRWLTIPCVTSKINHRNAPDLKPIQKQRAPFCFSPTDDPRMKIQIDKKTPLVFQAWLEEGEASALNDIKHAMQAVPDVAQAEHAKDLSQMLLGEANMFLVKFSQVLPEAFTWPSWQLQNWKAGQVPAQVYLPLIRRQKNPGDSLPALRYLDSGLDVSVDLYFAGRFHLSAKSK